MALRLLEMVLEEKDSEQVRALLEDCKLLEYRQFRSAGGEVLVRILLEAEQTEAVLNLLEERYTGAEGNRVVILPVEGTLPRAPAEPKPAASATSEESQLEKEPPERIAREELYEDIKNGARLTRVYMAMVLLSTIVAAIGLNHNNMGVIIGAMVIAPLLGPNVALSLGATLGDLPLLRNALLTALAGTAASLALAAVIGFLLEVDPTLSEIASRTRVGLSDVVLALASGCAGALAFTSGASATLIGVMVAVALLPPLVASGLLLGGGYPAMAMNALELFLINLISVNLAGVMTFLAQGIKPTSWWEKRSGHESHPHRRCAVAGAVGGVYRHDFAAPAGLTFVRSLALGLFLLVPVPKRRKAQLRHPKAHSNPRIECATLCELFRASLAEAWPALPIRYQA